MKRGLTRAALALPVAVFATLCVVVFEPSQSLEAGAIRRTLMDPEMVATGLVGLGIPEDLYIRVHVGRTLLVSALFFVAALLIALRARDTRAAGVFTFTFSAFSFLLFSDVLGPSTPPGPVIVSISSLLYTSIFFSFYLFPDGRFVPRWTRWLMAAWVLSAIAVGLPGADSQAVGLVVSLLVVGLTLSCPAALILRYRRHADAVQRQQIKWVVFGFGVMVVAWLLFWGIPAFVPGLQSDPEIVAAYDLFGGFLALVGYVAVPLTVLLALMRWKLWDVEPIVGRALVYGGLTAAVIAIYVAIVGYLATLLDVGGSLWISVVATGVVAVAIQPLRQLLQNGVNRLLYGQRDEPYEAITRLGRSLELTSSPEAVLPDVVDTLRDALKLPFVSVTVQDGEETITVAASGIPGGDVVVRQLTFGNELVGTLSLAPRAPGTVFSRSEQRLLDDMAAQLGPVAHAVRTSTELQRAREGLVRAREEERRWISQELHDGLGPLLASQPLTIAAARQSITSDSEVAAGMLDAAIEHAQVAVKDLRRIVRGLRPSTLASLGLIGALESLAEEFRSPSLQVETHLPPGLPPLSAAGEVACFRIAQEALANVLRHSGASVCQLRLAVTGELELTIDDNGSGLPEDARPGVGLYSMRTRAEELGGSFEIRSEPNAGTSVTARLPITAVL